MTYEDLIRGRRIKPYEAGEEEIQGLLEIASRDLSTAERLEDVDPDWAYNIAYNAMLQSARALMAHTGYRPRGPSQHATVAQFIKQTIGHERRNLAALFDQMRRKRNRLVYDVAGLVGKKEAEEALALAHEFVALMRSLIIEQ
jgi:uncharacterized protein (UPF0332 family)